MRAVNIHEAKTKLSRLVNQAAQGEPFIIAKAGKPLVKVVPLDAPQAIQRLGFMEGEILVPEDFGQMGSAEIDLSATHLAEIFRHKDFTFHKAQPLNGLRSIQRDDLHQWFARFGNDKWLTLSGLIDQPR